MGWICHWMVRSHITRLFETAGDTAIQLGLWSHYDISVLCAATYKGPAEWYKRNWCNEQISMQELSSKMEINGAIFALSWDVTVNVLNFWFRNGKCSFLRTKNNILIVNKKSQLICSNRSTSVSLSYTDFSYLSKVPYKNPSLNISLESCGNLGGKNRKSN
jgi:hypothetical protein